MRASCEYPRHPCHRSCIKTHPLQRHRRLQVPLDITATTPSLFCSRRQITSPSGKSCDQEIGLRGISIINQLPPPPSYPRPEPLILLGNTTTFTAAYRTYMFILSYRLAVSVRSHSACCCRRVLRVTQALSAALPPLNHCPIPDLKICLTCIACCRPGLDIRPDVRFGSRKSGTKSFLKRAMSAERRRLVRSSAKICRSHTALT